MTPYYDEAGITIYHGDCREVAPSLAPVDLVLTDPPYGINHKTNYATAGRGALAKCSDYPAVHGDDRPFDPEWLLSVGRGRILWGGNYYANRPENVSGWLVWDKERPDTLDQATCELAWTDCVKGVRRFRHLWNGMLRASERERGSLVHPTQKPVALMKWCMGLRWTRDYEVVIDPFMGSGSTLIAAKDIGRRAIGIEIEERYCEIAANRLAQGVLDFQVPRETATQPVLEFA